MTTHMIYINQDGETELGRGETIEQAISAANAGGFELTRDEIKTSTESRVVGDVYWTDSPVAGYND